LIAADFSNPWKEGFFDDIYNRIASLDISILINNAGMGHEFGNFHEIPESIFREEIAVDICPMILLTRKLIMPYKTKRQSIWIL